MNKTTEIINETIEPTKSGWKIAWKIIKTIGLVFTYVLGIMVLIGVGIFSLIVGIATSALTDGVGSGMASSMRPTNTRHSSYDQYKY